MIAVTFIIILLIIMIPLCLYVRHHRMKDIAVKLALFSGIQIKLSFYKDWEISDWKESEKVHGKPVVAFSIL